MTPLRAFSWLIPVLLIGLAIGGGLKLKQNFTDSLNKIRVEGDEYRRSPGCFPHVEDVNPALPPCQDLPVTLLSKTRQHQSGGKYQYAEWNENSVDVRDSGGRSHHLTGVQDEIWDGVKVEDQITAKFWRGRITYLVFNGSHSTAIDVTEHPAPLTDLGTKVWAGVFFVGFMGFFAWSGLRRVRRL